MLLPGADQPARSRIRVRGASDLGSPRAVMVTTSWRPAAPLEQRRAGTLDRAERSDPRAGCIGVQPRPLAVSPPPRRNRGTRNGGSTGPVRMGISRIRDAPHQPDAERHPQSPNRRAQPARSAAGSRDRDARRVPVRSPTGRNHPAPRTGISPAATTVPGCRFSGKPAARRANSRALLRADAQAMMLR
jgi:hypothetical protein